MRAATILIVSVLTLPALGAELESRVLTHYVPQDVLETTVRTEGWTEVPLNVKGGTRKGDTVRIWAGGSIDRGDSDQPGQNTVGPAGGKTDAVDPQKLALSPEPGHALAIVCKTESSGPQKCLPPGKALEIKLTKDTEKFWLGFNDAKGRFFDNRLGKGRRHELDPLWVRIEVVRTVVD